MRKGAAGEGAQTSSVGARPDPPEIIAQIKSSVDGNVSH